MRRLLLIMLFSQLCAGVRAEIHLFTLPDGREINAEIVALKAGKVTLKRADGKLVSVKPSIFVESDQDYIKQWALNDGVRSASNFKISCDRKCLDRWNEKKMGMVYYTDGGQDKGVEVGKISYEKVGYEISLKNRNKYDLTDLMLEYCIYYEQEASPKDPRQYVLYRSENLEKFSSQSAQTVVTKGVTVFKDEDNGDLIGAEVLQGEVHGITVRIYARNDDGKKVLLRTFSYPDKLATSRKWQTKSISPPSR